MQVWTMNFINGIWRQRLSAQKSKQDMCLKSMRDGDSVGYRSSAFVYGMSAARLIGR